MAHTAFVLTLILVAMTPEVASSNTSPCVDISAGLSAGNYGYYFFSGNKYTYYNSIVAMSVQGGGAVSVQPITDITGIEADVEITAGVMEPNSDHVGRLFTKSDAVYKVDLAQKKVLEQTTVASMFSASEAKIADKLKSGIQAGAILGQHRYFFSGCNVVKTDFGGNVEYLNLEDSNLPCDVDAALAFPTRDSPHLVITKGPRAYGWLPASKGQGYYMFCVASVFPNIAFSLCTCDQ